MNKLAEAVFKEGPAIKAYLEGMSQEELIEAYLTMQTVVAVFIKEQPMMANLFFTLNQSLVDPLMDVMVKFEAAAKVDWDRLKSRN